MKLQEYFCAQENKTLFNYLLNTEEEKNCRIKSLFLFSLRTKSILVGITVEPCHMDYFNTFLLLERGSCIVAGQTAFGFHQKYLNLRSEDE